SYWFFCSSRRRHTRSKRDWSSDVCSSDLTLMVAISLTRSAILMLVRLYSTTSASTAAQMTIMTTTALMELSMFSTEVVVSTVKVDRKSDVKGKRIQAVCQNKHERMADM